MALGAGEEPALQAINYGDFLYNRMYCRVQQHYLRTEWPARLASRVPQASLLDLAYLLIRQRNNSKFLVLAPIPAGQTLFVEQALQDVTIGQHNQLRSANIQLAECSLLTLIVDWYCLRQAGSEALAFIEPSRVELYAMLAHAMTHFYEQDNTSDAGFFCRFLQVLALSLRRAGYGSLQDQSRTRLLISSSVTG